MPIEPAAPEERSAAARRPRRAGRLGINYQRGEVGVPTHDRVTSRTCERVWPAYEERSSRVVRLDRVEDRRVDQLVARARVDLLTPALQLGVGVRPVEPIPHMQLGSRYVVHTSRRREGAEGADAIQLGSVARDHVQDVLYRSARIGDQV